MSTSMVSLATGSEAAMAWRSKVALRPEPSRLLIPLLCSREARRPLWNSPKGEENEEGGKWRVRLLGGSGRIALKEVRDFSSGYFASVSEVPE